ncbi:hypothetical protein ACFL0X_00995 [Nanoarchaeota archaeon]
MGLFDLDEKDEEIKDIVEDILDLYNDMNGKSIDELKQSHCGYERAYEKILHSLENYYDRDILGSGTPQFLVELIQEIENPTMVLPSTTITRVELGLKKVCRKLKIELPESKLGSKEEGANTPYIQNILQTHQFLNNEINITNDIKIEVNQAIRDFEEEVNKSNPNSSRLKTLFDIIKKGAGYGAIKVIEILLKRYYGLG